MQCLCSAFRDWLTTHVPIQLIATQESISSEDPTTRHEEAEDDTTTTLYTREARGTHMERRDGEPGYALSSYD